MQVDRGKAARKRHHRAVPAGTHQGGVNAMGKVFNFCGYSTNQGSAEESQHEPLYLISWEIPVLKEARQTPRQETGSYSRKNPRVWISCKALQNDTSMQEAHQECKASAGTHWTWRRFSYIQRHRSLNRGNKNICQWSLNISRDQESRSGVPLSNWFSWFSEKDADHDGNQP